MALAWFDCRSGASGDMALGALVDAGAPLDVMQAAVDAVGVEPIRLSAHPVDRQGLAATWVRVEAEATPVVRTWANVRDLLERADLSESVRATALDVFARLAAAEARAHRVAPEQVHFHEVGALDAVADVVGVAAGLEALGVREVAASEVALGGGMVRAAHGLLPVPGPAVLELLAEAGAPVRGGPVPYELCTPTGAALLASVVGAWGDLPAMTVTATGVGAGSRDLDGEAPNVLRVVVGERAARRAGGAEGSDAVVLEANVDDLDPRLWPHVLARLIEAGAADAWLAPILMKKGRPAHTLHVLAGPDDVEALARLVFAETSTLGLRVVPVGKRALARGELRVQVGGPGGGRSVRVKTGLLDGAVVNAQPEWEDVAAAAAALGRPAKDVLAEAAAVARAALADDVGAVARPIGADGLAARSDPPPRPVPPREA